MLSTPDSALRTPRCYGILCLTSEVRLLIEVSAAVIFRDDEVLICRRAGGRHAGLWEFPGGKREGDETAAACLVRECDEELGVRLSVGEALAALPWQGADQEMLFTFFAASLDQGEPQCRVHDQIRWVRPNELSSYVFCPADTAVLDRLFPDR